MSAKTIKSWLANLEEVVRDMNDTYAPGLPPIEAGDLKEAVEDLIAEFNGYIEAGDYA